MDKANNSEHQIPTVDEANEDSISEQDLDDLHSSVISNISSNVTDSKIRWELRSSSSQSDKKSDKVRTYQCTDDVTLMKFMEPLRPLYYNAIIMRIDSDRANVNLLHTGYIIPLSACPGCSIYDDKNKISVQLELGKKLHLSRRGLILQIDTKCAINLLWLFKNKRDYNKEDNDSSTRLG